MQILLKDAEKLTNVPSSKTIKRNSKEEPKTKKGQGTITIGKDAQGRLVVEGSELIRYYGTPIGEIEALSHTHKDKSKDMSELDPPSVHPEKDSKIMLLEQQLKFSNEQKEFFENQAQKLEQEKEDWKQQAQKLLLTYQPQQNQVKEEPTPHKKTWPQNALFAFVVLFVLFGALMYGQGYITLSDGLKIEKTTPPQQ